MYLTSKIPYKFWRKYSFYFFIGALILTAAVFIPGFGYTHGGAQRWLSLGPFSFQPAELLKIAFVLYFAGWLSWVGDKARHVLYGIVPFFIMVGFVSVVLLFQPDTKSLLLLTISGIGMLFIAGMKWKHILSLLVLACVAFIILASFKPYLTDRIKTFVNPGQDLQGSSWQIDQSLIAIGSGGLFGRGYGQSVQKFSYLPEPHGDSIFAVIGEEFGFLGTMVILFLYLLFALRGLYIASRAPDVFSRLFVFGIVILFISQIYLNIASLVGLFPLTGVPLIFISHGGTSLAISLATIGIILNISKHMKKQVV